MRDGWKDVETGSDDLLRVVQLDGPYVLLGRPHEGKVRWQLQDGTGGSRLVSDLFDSLEAAMDAAEWLGQHDTQACSGCNISIPLRRERAARRSTGSRATADGAT